MVEPMRVLQVFAQMNRGGAETMIMNLYRNIDRTKIQFDFVVHTEEECIFDKEIRGYGGRIYRIPRYIGKNHFAYKKAWVDFFKKYPNYRIIHGHVRSTASIYLKIAKENGLITIAHSHNISSGKGISAQIKNILQNSIRHHADYMFACSKLAGIWLFGEEATKSDGFYLFNNAIESKKFIFNSEIRNQMRDELDIKNKFVVGHVGRFHPQKNHEFLLEIFNSIKQKVENAVLLLVGDGELRNHILNKAELMGIRDDVIYLGVRSDISDIYQAMDVFVFPSNYEGLGIVAVEAQASGLSTFVSSKVVPDEAKVSPLMHAISLKKSADYWAKEIINKSNSKRLNMQENIIRAKYDIDESVEWLTDFYLKVSNQHG